MKQEWIPLVGYFQNVDGIVVMSLAPKGICRYDSVTCLVSELPVLSVFIEESDEILLFRSVDNILQRITNGEFFSGKKSKAIFVT